MKRQLLLLLCFTFGPLYGESQAIFAGGCFWCMQQPFDELLGKGVLKTEVGYTGGTVSDPSYSAVTKGGTDHREAILIDYDPKLITYQQLLELYWRQVDPTDAKGQFCDKGEQYTTAIFYTDEEQRLAAKTSKEELLKSGKVPIITTKILPAKTFYPAEESHQKYYKKHPLLYKYYTLSCGRKSRLNEVWK